MPKLEAYHRDLPYSYALGIFPATECLRARPEACRRLLVHSAARESEGVAQLIAACTTRDIRVEEADRVLARLSQKENCFAAMVFEKQPGTLAPNKPHIVLHHPADSGNVGTILRTALGLGVGSVAIIRPAVDVYDPRVVRASMGALFRLQVAYFDDIAAYCAAFPGQALYPFMLTGATPLPEAVRTLRQPYALVFGNEATGLPDEFAALGQSVFIPQSAAVDSLNVAVAAAIGLYAFRQAEGALDSAVIKEEV